MEKRIGYTVEINTNGQNMVVGNVKYFVYITNLNKCMANFVHVLSQDGVIHTQVQHLRRVKNLDVEETIVVFIENIKQKLLYLTGNDNLLCVSSFPNRN